MSSWFTKEMDVKVEQQLAHYFKKYRVKSKPFVTISREFGCDGQALAKRIVEKLHENGENDWYILNRTKLLEKLQDQQVSEKTLAFLEEFGEESMSSYIREALFGAPNQHTTIEEIAKVLRLLAKRGHVVFLGGGSSVLTREIQHGIHIRLFASPEWRAKNYGKRHALNEVEALAKVRKESEHREGYIALTGENMNDRRHYHMLFNNEKVTSDQAAESVLPFIHLCSR